MLSGRKVSPFSRILTKIIRSKIITTILIKCGWNQLQKIFQDGILFVIPSEDKLSQLGRATDRGQEPRGTALAEGREELPGGQLRGPSWRVRGAAPGGGRARSLD